MSVLGFLTGECDVAGSQNEIRRHALFALASDLIARQNNFCDHAARSLRCQSEIWSQQIGLMGQSIFSGNNPGIQRDAGAAESLGERGRNRTYNLLIKSLF